MALSASFQKKLLQQCAPFLHFAPTERYFPSDVNAWITSAFKEKWTIGDSHKGGNAVLRVLNQDAFPNGFPSAADVIAGFDSPAGTRLEPASLEDISSGVRTLLREGRQDIFMDFAGWPPESGGTGANDFTRGSPENIYPPFSVLAAALNSANQEEPDALQVPSTAASPHTTQGKAPTFYGQVSWAGTFSRMSDQLEATVAGSGDFGPSNSLRSALDKLIVLTYNFFYPLTDTPPDPGSALGISAVQREGQWEAVSLFFKFNPDFSHTTQGPGVPGDGTITIPDFNDPAVGGSPTLIALSYSATSRSDDPAPPARVLFADDSTITYPLRNSGGDGLALNPASGYAPAVYVTSGIHKNMFGPVDTKTTTDQGPNSDLIDAGAGVAAAAGAVSAIPGIGWIFGLILALIAILLVILGSVLRNSSTTYTPSGPDNDFVPPGGPSTGPPGSPGALSVEPTIVNTFSELPAAAGESADPLFQLPPWWAFCGRWGIRVEPSSDARWDNGMRFTDSQGRNRAYWNTLALLAFISDDANATKAMTLLD